MSQPQAATSALFRFFNEIGIISQLAETELKRALGPGLGSSEFGVLNHFVRLGRAETPSRLARAFQVTKPSMTAIVEKLARKGLVHVVTDDSDRRSKIVSITPAGRDAHQGAIQAIAPLLAELAAALPVKDMLASLPLLEQVRMYLDTRRNEADGL